MNKTNILSMFRKVRRYVTIFRVFLKYNLFSLLYSEVNQYYVSNRKNPCVIDVKNRERAVKLRKALEELGPTFIKLGQILSNLNSAVFRA